MVDWWFAEVVVVALLLLAGGFASAAAKAKYESAHYCRTLQVVFNDVARARRALPDVGAVAAALDDAEAAGRAGLDVKDKDDV